MVEKNSQSFRRGQIWMVIEPAEMSNLKIKLRDRAIAYNRPCLIVQSDDTLDTDCPLIQVIPISSAPPKDSFTEWFVPYVNENGDLARIIINQTTVKMKMNCKYYLSELDEKTMHDVDIELAKYMGLPYEVDPVSKRLDDLNDSIHNLEKAVLAEKISQSIQLKRPMANQKNATDATIEVPTYKDKESKNKIVWDEKNINEFVSDLETLTSDEIGKKWQVGNKGLQSVITSIASKK